MALSFMSANQEVAFYYQFKNSPFGINIRDILVIVVNGSSPECWITVRLDCVIISIRSTGIKYSIDGFVCKLIVKSIIRVARTVITREPNTVVDQIFGISVFATFRAWETKFVFGPSAPTLIALTPERPFRGLCSDTDLMFTCVVFLATIVIINQLSIRIIANNNGLSISCVCLTSCCVINWNYR